MPSPQQQQRCKLQCHSNNSIVSCSAIIIAALRAVAPSLLQHCKRQRCHRYDLGSSHIRPTFVGRFVHVRPSVKLPSIHRLPFDVHWTFVLHPTILRPIILPHAPCHHTSYVMTHSQVPNWTHLKVQLCWVAESWDLRGTLDFQH
jgi:hypothetical protein